jgi:hypothetical protein
MRIDVPQPLAVVPSLRLGLVEAIPGRPLLPDLVKAACDSGGQLPGSDSGALEDGVRAAARTAATVHLCAPAGSQLPVRDLAQERAATELDLTLLEPVWPGVSAHLRATVARAFEGLPESGPVTASAGWPLAPVLVHGDFTLRQVLIGTYGRAGIVDVDTLCIAEPALDLGRFLAYLHVTGVRRSRAAGPLLAELTAVFLEAYLALYPAFDGATAPATDTRRTFLGRTAAYRALALARMGASACWQLKDGRLGAVVDVLDRENEWTKLVAG